ncbi:MAG: HlyD family efflux transporter periplasmic adaptor subunit [Parvularculaceae bacterium]
MWKPTLFISRRRTPASSNRSRQEGDAVAEGEILFTLDPARLSYAAAQASAAADSAAARAADDGSMTKRIEEAQAALELADRTYQRSRALVKDGAVSREKFDSDAANLKAARARLGQLQGERDAMLRDWDAASALASLAERRVADLATAAPSAGRIERIYRRPGEIAAAGEPVLSLLAPANIKLKFFAPEGKLSTLALGDAVRFTCDGCDAPKTAKISYIAREPQFTPPIIYSLKERAKLVFLVEARPDDPETLRPGLPVTIELE